MTLVAAAPWPTRHSHFALVGWCHLSPPKRAPTPPNPMTQARRINYDRDFIEAFVAQFSASPPVEIRRERPVTKQALVTLVRPTIDQWRKDGCSLGAIARHFADLGIAMPLSTLRSCLRRSHLAAPRSRRPRRSARSRSAKPVGVPMKPAALDRTEIEREQQSATKSTRAASEGPAPAAAPAVSHRAHPDAQLASLRQSIRRQPDAPLHQAAGISVPTTTQQQDESRPNEEAQSALPLKAVPDAASTRSLREEVAPPVVSASARTALLQRARAAPANLAVIGFTPARNEFF